jgi:cellulose synthase/poly-beta-1,6-N-acetylglucosamine synthase-like glycosyltransferase
VDIPWLLTNIWIIAFIFFIIFYFGYFFLVLILAKIKEKKIRKAEDFAPFISILIPCYNVALSIDHKMKNTLEVDYPKDKFEIIAVESGSTDNTYSILSKYADQGKIKLLRQPQRLGKSSAINYGLSACNGDIIVMTDADAILEEKGVKELVKNFADDSVGAVVGNVTLISGKSVISRMNQAFYRIFRQKLRELESRFDSVSFWSGELCAFRKSLLERVEEDIINDDRYILLKIRSKGYRCISEPLARVYEKDAESVKGQMNHKRRTTAGTIQGTFRFKHMLFNTKYGFFGMLIFPAHFLRIILLPTLLLIIEVLSPFAIFVFVSSFNGAFSLLVVAIVLALLGLFDGGRKLLFSLLYGVFVQVAIISGVADYILKRQSALWEPIVKG